jgi:hypothetical protein
MSVRCATWYQGTWIAAVVVTRNTAKIASRAFRDSIARTRAYQGYFWGASAGRRICVYWSKDGTPSGHC